MEDEAELNFEDQDELPDTQHHQSFSYYNNTNLHDYDLWLDDNNDSLWAIFKTGTVKGAFSDDFYEAMYHNENNTLCS